jgi:hypothetical protein
MLTQHHIHIQALKDIGMTLVANLNIVYIHNYLYIYVYIYIHS